MKDFLKDYWDAIVALLAVIAMAIIFSVIQGCSFVSVQIATDKSVVNKKIDPLRLEVKVGEE